MNIESFIKTNGFTHFSFDGSKYKIGLPNYQSGWFDCKMLGCKYGKNHPLPIESENVSVINDCCLIINFRSYEFIKKS